ncbi:hypothetical protein HDV06_001377 [Boothiomyces sp. JEL0866]|nr:hypothetical protein HDV06_001377 [Boothiomyces sp. JEL0866]
MEITTELQQSIAKAAEAVEKAQSVYENTLAEFNQLRAAYEADFRQNHPNASIVVINNYLKTALKTEYENLARKEQNLAQEKQNLAQEKQNLARKEDKEQELLKQQTLLLERERQSITSKLTVGTAMDIDSTSQRAPFVRTKSDEEFIENNNLDLRKPSNSLQYLIYLLEKVVDIPKMPNSAAFHDNCLEYRLDRRTTQYVPNDVDNVKLLLAVSGAGKTRMLLELLYSNFGYYFTSKSSQGDFGSGDFYQCQVYCDKHPENVKRAIHLLYFVRAAVCNYLMGKGFKEPWQILLAQLHPVAFFGIDLFEHLFTALLEEQVSVGIATVKPFQFIAIDEIQLCVESMAVHLLPGSANNRPFFSPLVHYSKMMRNFPHFLLSGTGINFEFVKEAMESSTMKDNQMTNYEVVSNFHALSREDIEIYAYQFLQEHQILEVDDIVSRISAFELCHGRPRFVAFILDRYMKSRDIDVAIGEFVSGIATVDGLIFPLRFFKRDLDNNIRSLDRTISGDTLGRVIREGLLEVILKGRLRFRVTDDDGAAAIRYGLGFGEVRYGILKRIDIQELAVVECLRYFIPFADIVKAFAKRLAECPKPQMVGYLVEYLVAFALVANKSGGDAGDRIQVWQDSAEYYLQHSDSSQVCFPDHMCGPDIIYKCKKTKTVYIVQVKFVKGISKQEAASACDTTNPDLFYCKRKGNGVLRGFEQSRLQLNDSLTQLQLDGYSLQQMLFIHTGGTQTSFTQGALVVTKSERAKPCSGKAESCSGKAESCSEGRQRAGASQTANSFIGKRKTRAPFVRTKSDKEFIQNNFLSLRKPSNPLKYLIGLLEKVVDIPKMPNSAAFHDNCLEYRLDRRTTQYVPNDVDNVKLLLAVSGAGKTRMLLELLYSNFGYYFTSKSSQGDFGSGDFYQCQVYCDKHPENVKRAIHLLYFVRAAVCNYLMGKGFKEPWQILLAQLHPVAFFGIDLFEHLFTALLEEQVSVGIATVKPFQFIAIDEIQLCVESMAVHSLPGCTSDRPFFSPLMQYSKMMRNFPHFLLSGTGINFEFVKEAMESSTMKDNQMTNYEVVSNFHALSREDIEIYAYQFLQEHQILEVDDIVSRISAFELCHGRPRFVAFILDRYMKSRDIDVAIGEFVSGIATVDGLIFPLRFFKRDLDNNIRSLDRTISGDTLGRVIREGLLEVILKGRLRFRVTEDDGAAAIRYGLGFGEVRYGILKRIDIQELAVVECLRYFIPFADIVKTFAKRLAECPKPQMVGYLVEYLVAFALVANKSGGDAGDRIQVWQDSAEYYLQHSDSSQVCFPDHMCGPDIIYKCKKTKTVYIVQVKFVKGISKQEAASACDTTNPDLFYCKRKGNGVLRGFEQSRLQLNDSLTQLQLDGYSLQQMLFIHTGGTQTSFTQGALVVTKPSDPEFFNSIASGVWEFLDSVSSNFE